MQIYERMVSPPDIVTTVTPPEMIKKQSQGGMPEESMVSLYSEEPVRVIEIVDKPQKMDVAIYAEVTQPNGYTSEWMLDPRVVIQRLLGLEKPTDLWQIGGNGRFDL